MMKSHVFHNKLDKRRHTVDLLFTLALFCVFAASSLMVVLIGARVYKNNVMVAQDNFQTRTSVSYIATKIRQSDVTGGIRIDKLAGQDALVLTQRIGDSVYETWIYHFEDDLRETLVAAGANFSPETGQVILPLASFRMQQETPSLIALEFVLESGEAHPLFISPRS